MQKPTILIADDHRMIVDAFRKFLEPAYEIVAEVGDGLALLERAPALKPDVIIVDIGMPHLNGVAAGKKLKQLLPRTKIIYVTMNEDGDLAAEAIASGASGYLLKSSAASELLKAIREALRGGRYITPAINKAVEASFIRSPMPHPAGKELTTRQIEVLQLLAEGRLMKEVADVLGLTPRTVAFHKYRIMERLDVHSNAELIRYAVTHHVVQSKEFHH